MPDTDGSENRNWSFLQGLKKYLQKYGMVAILLA